MAENPDPNADEARRIAIEKMQLAREQVAKKDAASKKQSDDDVSISTIGIDKLKPKKIKHSSSKKREPLDLTILKSVKVYSPFRVYFDGPANSLSAVNGTGPFDVLPGHKNFLSLLQSCTLIVRSKRGQEEMKIERGVLHVRDNEVTVFLDV